MARLSPTDPVESESELIAVAAPGRANSKARKPAGSEQSDGYLVLLGEIDALLGDARRKVDTALLASMDDRERMRELTRLDGLLAEPAQLSHDLLRAKSQ